MPYSYRKGSAVESECVVATYEYKQDCLLCNKTHRETDIFSFHVSRRASFNHVNLQSFLHVIAWQALDLRHMFGMHNILCYLILP